MSNSFELIEVENSAGEIEQHVVIVNANGFTSMLKSTYDQIQEINNG
jgi:hypothetical protein